MSEEGGKVEWSFDFENMSARVGQFVSDMMGGTVEAKRATLHEKRDGARTAQVQIDFSVGRATVNALDIDSPHLFQAELRYIGEYEYEASGGAERVISLRQKGSSARDLAALAGNAQDLHWDVALAQGIPLTLRLKGGIGESDIDLSRLLVESFRLETGVGQVALTTSLQESGFTAEVTGGVGKTEVAIPSGSNGRLKIAGGVGEVGVSVAPEAAVRVTGKTGLGRMSLPEGFERLAGSGKHASGVWESPEFADAANQVVIEFEGGVGSFGLRYFDVL
jgi:hypothetical protein